MNFIRNRKVLVVSVFSVFFGFKSYSQLHNVVVSQDPKFEKLLNEKRKIFVGNISDEEYRIQFFTGTADEAKKNLVAIRKEFLDLESTIVFSTPNYKVVAGSFKSRIEAERNLLVVKKVYKNAFLIRPRK